jgi:hypothetical protein
VTSTGGTRRLVVRAVVVAVVLAAVLLGGIFLLDFFGSQPQPFQYLLH